MRDLPTAAVASAIRRFTTWNPSRPVMALLVVVAGAYFSWLMLRRTGLARRIPLGGDSTADWLLTNAFYDGLDPYTPLEDLGARYGVPYVSPLVGANPPAPRLPGAFLVQAPMLLTSPAGVARWMVALGCAAAVSAVWRVSRRHPVPWLLGVGYLSIGLVSGMAMWGFGYVNSSIVIVGLMVVLLGRSDTRPGAFLAGGSIAVAATLKVFPLILLFAMARRRRWAVVGWGLGVFLALNLLPLVTPHVSLSGVVSVLAETFDTWFSSGGVNNISPLAAVDRLVSLSDATVILLQVVVLGIGLGAIIWRQPSWDFEQGALVLLGLMCTAVVWPHYVLLALPFLLLVVVNPLTSNVTRLILICVTILFIPARPSPWWAVGIVTMFTTLVVEGGRDRVRTGQPNQSDFEVGQVKGEKLALLH